MIKFNKNINYSSSAVYEIFLESFFSGILIISLLNNYFGIGKSEDTQNTVKKSMPEFKSVIHDE